MAQTAPQHTKHGIIDPTLLSVAVVWGVGNIASKWLLGAFEPGALFALRNLASGLLMAVLLVMRPRRIARRDLLLLLLVGGGLVAVQQLSFIYAVSMTTASEGSLLVSTAPVWTAVIVAMLGMELVTGLNWVGITVASVGVAMLVLGQGGSVADAPARIHGDLLMIGSAWLYAGYMVLSKRWMQRLGALIVTAYSFIGAGILLPLVTWGQIMDIAPAQIAWTYWFWFAFLSVGAGFWGIATWYRAISRTTASGTAVYQYIVPCVSFACAAIALHERLTGLQLLGIVVALGGVYMARIPAPQGANR